MAEHIHRQDGILPEPLLKELAALGVFGISIPEEYGGSFLDNLSGPVKLSAHWSLKLSAILHQAIAITIKGCWDIALWLVGSLAHFFPPLRS
jgi:alkylation response protein AidB-like acyl-CoA dehydrogenase